MLVLLKIFDDLAIDSLVLECSVQDDEHFRCDTPVVQVRDVSFQDELECANRAYLVFVLSIEAFKQIYAQTKDQIIWISD